MAVYDSTGQLITVSAYIPWGDRFLIVKRAKVAKFLPLHWELPGGKVEEGEEAEDAVVREVLEETRLAVRPVHVYGTFTCAASDNSRMLEHAIRCELVGPTNVLLSSEHEDFRWISKDEIKKTDPMTDFMRDIIEKGITHT